MTTTDNYFSFIPSTLLTRAFNLVSTSGIRLDPIVVRRFTVDLIIFFHLGRLLINDSINKKMNEQQFSELIKQTCQIFVFSCQCEINIFSFWTLWLRKKREFHFFFTLSDIFKTQQFVNQLEKLELAPSGCCQVAVPELCRQIMLTF